MLLFLALEVLLPVKSLITFDVSCPEILITATPEIPGPLDKCINCHILSLNNIKSYIKNQSIVRALLFLKMVNFIYYK